MRAAMRRREIYCYYLSPSRLLTPTETVDEVYYGK